MPRYARLLLALLLFAGCRSTDSRTVSLERPAVEPLAVPRYQPPALALSEAEAVGLALERSEVLHAYRDELAAVYAARGQPYEIDDPELRLAYGESRRTDSSDPALTRREETESYRGALRVFPPNPWTLSAQRKQRLAFTAVAEANLAAAERRVVFATRRALLLMAQLRERTALAEADVARCQRAQAAWVERVGLGLATASDTVASRVDELEAVLRRDSLNRELRHAEAELALLLGLATVPPLAPRPATGSTVAVDDLAEQAQARRPDLLALAWRVEVARYDLAEAQSLRVPWFSHLQGAYGEDESLAHEESWSVQAGIDLPFFSGRGREASRGRLDLARMEAALRVAQAEVVAEVQRAADALAAADEAASEHDRRVGPLVVELAARLADEELLRGLSPDEVSSLERGLLRARQAALSAEHARERACLQLEEALGAPGGEPAATGAPAVAKQPAPATLPAVEDLSVPAAP